MNFGHKLEPIAAMGILLCWKSIDISIEKGGGGVKRGAGKYVYSIPVPSLSLYTLLLHFCFSITDTHIMANILTVCTLPFSPFKRHCQKKAGKDDVL